MLSISTLLYYDAVMPRTGEYAAVVVDVLRATTTICSALNSGAAGVIPVKSEISAIDEAKRLAQTGNESVIGGEKGGLKIPGFELGNSPVEYSPSVISAKTVILLTTNGTAAIRKMEAASLLYTAAFVNIGVTVKALAASDVPVIIVCSGNSGLPCFEDTLCAGALIYELRKLRNIDIDDTSLIAAEIYDRNKGEIETVLREKCKHGRYLGKIGFGEDITFASRVNIFDFTVILTENRVLVKSDGEF